MYTGQRYIIIFFSSLLEFRSMPVCGFSIDATRPLIEFINSVYDISSRKYIYDTNVDPYVKS